MARGLKNDLQLWKLARDLRLPGKNPFDEIVAYCSAQMRALLKEFPCDSLSQLLEHATDRLQTRFIKIRTDEELLEVRDRFLKRGEKEFALLEAELAPGVFAITFRLLKPRKGEREFVSIIDGRGEKGFRSYFSKWHELAHLLTLTDQMRFKFCRTHSSLNKKDPEEALMEAIAGHVGFLPEIVKRHAQGEISFEKIHALRDQLCPEASIQAATINLAKAWPSPCVLIEAGPEYKASEKLRLSQPDFGFLPAPLPKLRLLHISSNSGGESIGNRLHQNMRVPLKSVIHEIFANESLTAIDVDENLNWWETSRQGHLPNTPIRVHARKNANNVQALLIPS